VALVKMVNLVRIDLMRSAKFTWETRRAKNLAVLLLLERAKHSWCCWKIFLHSRVYLLFLQPVWMLIWKTLLNNQRRSACTFLWLVVLLVAWGRFPAVLLKGVRPHITLIIVDSCLFSTFNELTHIVCTHLCRLRFLHLGFHVRSSEYIWLILLKKFSTCDWRLQWKTDHTKIIQKKVDLLVHFCYAMWLFKLILWICTLYLFFKCLLLFCITKLYVFVFIYLPHDYNNYKEMQKKM